MGERGRVGSVAFGGQSGAENFFHPLIPSPIVTAPLYRQFATGSIADEYLGVIVTDAFE